MSDIAAPPPTVQSPLYDLLARSWTLEAGIHSACIDKGNRTVAFALDDGRVALAPVKDPESATSRMRVEGDSGRAIIRARTKPVADLLLTKPLADGPVMLVGHSAGAALAHAALDARPDRVARAIYVGGFPTGDGDPPVDGLASDQGEISLPDWSNFEEEELVDLDDRLRAEFRQRAIPSPARAASDPQRLSDERRYHVPVTVICTEFTGDMLQQWVAQGESPVREFTKIRDVEYVDLPTGHWPQFTRSADLARIILQRA